MSFTHRVVPTALFCASLAWLTPAIAQSEHPIETELQRCMDATESTHGMLGCSDTASGAWDTELNRVWKALMSEIGATEREPLRAAQRKWIAFRDAEKQALEAAYGAMQGSMFQIMHTDAVTELTRDRVRQLESLLEAQRSSAG